MCCFGVLGIAFIILPAGGVLKYTILNPTALKVEKLPIGNPMKKDTPKELCKMLLLI